jgi:tetratricopeptide (TPR) repeat protein
VSLLRRCYHWLRKATAGRTRKRLRGLIGQLDATSPRRPAPAAVEQCVARLCQPHRELFPAAIARLELQTAIEAARGRNPRKAGQSIETLTRWLDHPDMQWSDEEAAAAVGTVIRLLMAGQPDNRALDAAFALFSGFRRRSEAFVPEAFPLVVRLAQPEVLRCDRAAALAYIEYLACAERTADRQHAAIVEGALQRAARPQAADAEEINSIAKDVCHAPWAIENLIEVYYRSGQFAKAKQEMLEGRSSAPPPANAAEWFRAGMIHRALGEWSAALPHFERIQGTDATEPLRRPASAYRLEALFHESDRQLCRGLPLAGDPIELWRQWCGELDALLPAPDAPRSPDVALAPPLPPAADAPALPVDVIRGLLLRLDRRMHPPAKGRQRLLGWTTTPDNGRLPPDAGPLLWDHMPVDPADWTVAAQNPAMAAERLDLGRRLLTRGHISWLLGVLQQFDDAEGAQSSGDAVVDLLRADYCTRTGRLAAADDLLKQHDWPGLGLAEASLSVQVDAALAGNAAGQAMNLLQSPAGTVLPYLTREVALAEALHLQGDWQAAGRQYARVLGAAPCSPYALNSFGWAELNLGQDGVAAECFRRALHVQPDHCYVRLGQWLACGVGSSQAQDLLCREPQLGQIAAPLSARLLASGRCDLAEQLAATFPSTTDPR